jgi:hypothetical protein
MIPGAAEVASRHVLSWEAKALIAYGKSLKMLKVDAKVMIRDAQVVRMPSA